MASSRSTARNFILWCNSAKHHTNTSLLLLGYTKAQTPDENFCPALCRFSAYSVDFAESVAKESTFGKIWAHQT